jgi:hypothetical protein
MKRTFRVLLAVLTVATGLLIAAPAAHAAYTVGTTYLTGQGSDACLDDSSAYGFRMWYCNYGDAQRWIEWAWDDGTVRFQNVGTGRCLDDTDDFGLRTWDCNNGMNQSWWPRVWDDGTHRYKNQATSLCIGHGETAGNVRRLVCDSSVAESWWVSPGIF